MLIYPWFLREEPGVKLLPENALGKQTKECSTYQKPLRERKGDFKGKEFVLDCLAGVFHRKMNNVKI